MHTNSDSRFPSLECQMSQWKHFPVNTPLPVHTPRSTSPSPDLLARWSGVLQSFHQRSKRLSAFLKPAPVDFQQMFQIKGTVPLRIRSRFQRVAEEQFLGKPTWCRCGADASVGSSGDCSPLSPQALGDPQGLGPKSKSSGGPINRTGLQSKGGAARSSVPTMPLRRQPGRCEGQAAWSQACCTPRSRHWCAGRGCPRQHSRICSLPLVFNHL